MELMELFQRLKLEDLEFFLKIWNILKLLVFETGSY